MLILKTFTLLVFIYILSLSGILIFLKGFLLSRSVVERKSECLVEFALRAEDNHTHHAKGCWMHSRFKRAIIVLIDALKYDFMEYNETLGIDEIQNIHFKNKLTILHQLKTKKPLNSRLYKFIADPPTTTMQRLKGLTTGSLPTFVDAGANFKSYHITEDNILEQLVQQNKKIKFFGDDTWLGLFPDQFHQSFGFPSFNIQDLHSVDDGILANIYSEMKKSDWDVIIAHFLGVDHCGHRFGPNFPAMRDKLLQMNAMLSNITQLMQDDTILFVMGDHGMTNTGDHGGDSVAELEAGLFIYSPTQIASSQQKDDNTVKQVDFVPTISLLLGLPIPFSNLGMVITDLFTHCPWWSTATNDIRQAYHKIKALRMNAYQISSYLSAYQSQASDLPENELRALQQLFTNTEQEIQKYITMMAKDGVKSDTLSKFQSLENSYRTFIRDTRQICENVWAKFDLKWMLIGILTLALGVAQSLYLWASWSNDETSLPTSAKFLLGGSLAYLICIAVHLFIFPTSVPLMPVTLAALLIVANFVCVKSFMPEMFVVKRYFTLVNVVSSVLFIMNCCIYFSNSFVVNEDEISMFLLQTLVCIFSASIILSKKSLRGKTEHTKYSKKSKSSFDIMQVVLHPKTVCFFVCLSLCALLRLSSSFIPCREEQVSCRNSVFPQPLASLEGATKNKRYIFSIVSLVVMVYASRRWLKHFGNLNGTSPGVVAMLYGPPLAALFTCLHWALQGLSDLVSDSFTPWQLALMAQAVYVVLLVSIVTLTVWPLLIFMIPSKANSALYLSHKGDLQHIIPTIYNQLKVNFQQSHNEKDSERSPIIYGLGSAYSASICAYLVLFGLLLTLLLSDGTAPSITLGILVLYLCLELYSAAIVSNSKHEEDMSSPRWAGLVLFNLLSTVFFYTTGHQATVPSIRFEAGYVGFYGDLKSFILPGFLVWLNTFAGPVFFSLAGPLVIFWPLLFSGLASWMINKKSEQVKEKTSWQGDFSIFNNGIKLNKHLFSLVCGTIFITSLKLLFATCAAALHRRHLMVWKIFAPRLVYESALFVTVTACMFVVCLFVHRVDRALIQFVKHIHPDKDS
ncbi:GPI ethanolamine phosphate transferase 3 [Biomphalaria glabrata]